MSGTETALCAGAQGDLFLPVLAGTQWLAVPLTDVERLTPARTPGGTPEPPALSLAGDGADAPLALYLRGQRGPFVLRVSRAEPLLQVPAEALLPLPEALRCGRSRHLAGAFLWEEQAALCFLLDCRALEALLPERGDRDA